MSETYTIPISDTPRLYVKIMVTSNTVKTVDPVVLARVISRLTHTVKRMTANLPINIKRNLAYTNGENGRGVIWVYNCDPRLKTSDTWGENPSKWEYLSDIPGYEHLAAKMTFDGRPFASATAGVGGALDNELTSICIHNLSCQPGLNPYPEEDIFVHEYAHTILEVAVKTADRRLFQKWSNIHRIYRESLGDLCPSTYSCDVRESFALASQTWFNVTRRGDAQSIMPGIRTIEEIRNIGTEEEPTMMYDFLENLFGPPAALCVREITQPGYIETTLLRDNCKFCR